MPRKLYQEIASLVQAIRNCEESDNAEWLVRHRERLTALVDEHLPSGSGFDSGTRIAVDRSTRNRLVFATSYHHMDENGCYDGWTDHDVIVAPDLAFGFDLRVTGRNRRDIKEYIAETFSEILDREIAS